MKKIDFLKPVLVAAACTIGLGQREKAAKVREALVQLTSEPPKEQ